MVGALGLVLLAVCLGAQQLTVKLNNQRRGPRLPESARVQQIRVTLLWFMTRWRVMLTCALSTPSRRFSSGYCAQCRAGNFCLWRLNGKEWKSCQRSTLTFKWDGAANRDDNNQKEGLTETALAGGWRIVIGAALHALLGLTPEGSCVRNWATACVECTLAFAALLIAYIARPWRQLTGGGRSLHQHRRYCWQLR